MTVEPRALPADQVGRVRARLAAGGPAAAPRDAATVVLLRDAPGSGVEAYLLRRVASMAFAAGMYVFPGGSVDPRDAEAAMRWGEPGEERLSQVLAGGDRRLAQALVCAAVRETFEESGVLLAGSMTGEIADVSAPQWEADRLALLDRRMALVDLLRDRDLAVRADLLRPWAHWITPEAEPKRFDTRFFVAALPAGQDTRPVGGEADRVAWKRPEQALAEHRTGELAMLPPTSFTLAELADYPSVADVMAAALARDIAPVMPKVVVTGDEARILLPGDPGFDG